MSKLNKQFAADLLNWYDHHARDLLWRQRPHLCRQILSDPYQTWLSEVMLQQTTVTAVTPYFLKFIQKWPSIESLAKAKDDDVLTAWAGLGYYARARNLIKCARIIVEHYAGKFPSRSRELQKLPGIGSYISAAIAAISFAEPVAVIDGNVERVISRQIALKTALPHAKKEIHAALSPVVPDKRPGDFAQALMDLGATICTPKRPSCMICPVRSKCCAHKQGNSELYPIKPPPKDKPTRVGAAFVVLNPDGAVFLQKRTHQGLLANMAEVPGSDWSAKQDGATSVDAAPFDANWRFVGHVQHSFTHFHLKLKIYQTVWLHAGLPLPSGWWAAADALNQEPLPNIMRKIILKVFNSDLGAHIPSINTR